MSENTRVVSDFIDAFNALDLDKIMGFLKEDAVYHNIPVDAVQGTEAIRAVLQGFMGMATKVDWVLHNIAESQNGTVLTERTDRFFVGEKWIELPVMGIFEIEAGRICAWRDYFDMNQFQSQLGA
jgi:limonene-1,2-epoxide hydrolase